MKNIVRLIVLTLIVAMLAACGSQQYDANGNAIGGSGMSAGQGALLGGLGGYLLGRHTSRPAAYAAPNTVIQKNYYHPTPTAPAYRPSYTPRPGFASTPSVRSTGSFGSGMTRSSGGFGGGMRSSGGFGGGMRSGRR